LDQRRLVASPVIAPSDPPPLPGEAVRPRVTRAGEATHPLRGDLEERYTRHTAETVRAHLPWAVGTFMATYAAVAIFELELHPHRLPTYVWIYLIDVLWCALTVALTRASSTSPRFPLVPTTLCGVVLIANTSLYHILVHGEAEVLALGNLYLMFGFLAAFPWGGWPQLAVALAALAGLAVGLMTTVHASVSSGILLVGMASLGGLSVASAVLTDRYRRSLFLARDELKIAKEAAEAASHARRDLVASVSHDLRTPVNIIFGMADMALDVAVTEEQRELVATIKRAAGQLHALLNDLLDFSKMDAGVVDLAPRRFAVRPWLEGTLEPHASGAAAKGLQLVTVVDAAVPQSVVGDPDRLRQILGNLAGNAVKFTDAGQVAVRLGVSDGRGAQPMLRCAVSDTGIGIAADETARLFEPFVRAAATSRSHDGTGLGLAICKRLVEQMGGAIGVESSAGHGSTFWFMVPLG
jgi:signal transduction histidine kinase